MPFRHKISIAFSLVLLLTILVAVGSWQSMQKALSTQQELYSFQTHIERTFNALINQEQAFTTEQAIHHSTQVFEHIREMRSQVKQLLTREKTDAHRQQLAAMLPVLAEYENAFSSYVRDYLDLQSILSRLQLETDRLYRQLDLFTPLPSTEVRIIRQEAFSILLLQKEYIITPSEDKQNTLTEKTENLQKSISVFQKGTTNNNSLLAFRVGRAAQACMDVFHQYVAKVEVADSGLKSLRDAFVNLNTGFNKTINLKSSLVNKEIALLQKLTLLSAALAILLSIGATLILSRFITRPIEMLKYSALQIVNGDLEAEVKINSRDEIGELGQLFNTMTKRLRTTFGELERYKNQLEQLVSVRTQKLEQEILDRRETERQLAASEQRFRTIFDSSHDGIIIANPTNGTFLLINKTICTMLGYSRDELINLSVSALHPEKDRDWVLGEFHKGGQGLQHLFKDIPLVRKDGTIFPSEILTTTIMINDRRYLLGSFRDISERKSMEEERLKVRKLESVGVLAGGIAHDFNNILSAILGNVSLALALTQPDDQRFKLLSELEKASLRAKDLTHQLLTFSKGGEPVKELTSIAGIIRESAEFILRGSNIRCDFHFPADLWSGEVDPGQISQVVQNIVVNAQHAMPGGGVITISGRNVIPQEPETGESDNGRKVEVTISDNGPGIPEEYREKIFDPYFTTKKDGSGLGLAISHSIIRKHKGSITITCPEEGGTTFTLQLPAAVGKTLEKERSSAENSKKGSGTVLIMDDEQPVRDILSELLKHLGYNSILAVDGQETIDTYSRMLKEGSRPDLVIMDLTIPGGMGGREAAAELLALDPAAKLIVSSGYSQDPVMANYHDYGFSGFLSKPFQLQDLQIVLTQLLNEVSFLR